MSLDLYDTLREVLNSTKARKVVWREALRTDVYRVALGKGIIEVSQWTADRWGSEQVAVHVKNLEGNTISSVDTEDVRGEEEQRLLHELYLAARSSALNEDEIFESIVASARAGRMGELPVEVAPEEPEPDATSGSFSEDEIPF